MNTRKGVALIGTVLLSGCGDAQPDDSNAPAAATGAQAETTAAFFTEASVPSGLAFQHYSGARGDWHVPEILGSGVALLDYDSDGDLDVFFVQSNGDFHSPASAQDAAELFPLPSGQSKGHKLFANQLVPSGSLTFIDVTAEVGVGDDTYGMGVAVADYDNDGDPDLYVTSVGDNTLFRNDGGVFVVVEDAGGAQDSRWSTSASFCDLNNDQLPDLYVTNYVYYSRGDRVVCRDSLGQQDYCGPQSYSGVPDALFINNGDGSFVNRSDEWGVNTASSTGLGVSCRDFNQDGAVDVYVANDAMPNLLWRNQNAQRFDEQGQISGLAINVNGMSEGSMGVASGDYDGDGDDDVFITHWNNETNTLYRNDLDLGFLDVTRLANLAGPSLSHTGFGTEWLDVDNDGDLDVFVANGAVQRYIDGSGTLSTNYGQPNQLFMNSGAGRFESAGESAGAATASRLTGRGAAFGDLDNDGDTDIVVSNKDAEAKLFVNQVGNRNAWLGVELEGTRSSRDALGAVVTLALGDSRVMRQVVRTDGSYLSASDSRVLFGLGDRVGDVAVEVTWPSGQVQRFEALAVGQYHRLREQE